MNSSFALKGHDDPATLRNAEFAIKNGHTDDILEFLPFLAMINKRDPKTGNILALEACRAGRADYLVLLQPYSDMLTYSSWALQLSAGQSDSSVFDYLLEHMPPECNKDGGMMAAAQKGRWDLVEKILDTLAPQGYGCPAFLEACSSGDIDRVGSLLKRLQSSGGVDTALGRAASRGHLNIVEFLLPLLKKGEYSDALIKAAENGHLDVVKLLSQTIDPQMNSNEALFGAINKQHVDVVKYLLPRSRISSKDKCVLDAVAQRSNTALFTLFEKYFDSEHIKTAFANATRTNYVDMLRLLIQRHEKNQKPFSSIFSGTKAISLKEQTTPLLSLAVQHGAIDALKFLIPFADTRLDRSAALACASAVENKEAFDLLYPVSNADQALRTLKKTVGHKSKHCAMLLERIKIFETKKLLEDACLSPNQTPYPKRKM